MALGFMRRHRRWLYVFLWLVIAAFIILYIPAFQGADAGSPGELLAKVGDQTITVGQFQKSYTRQRQFYERLYQGRLDPQAMRRLGIEEQTFQSLVEERLVTLEARRLGFTVSDETVKRTLETSPDFKEDGRFLGGEEIRRRLDMQGISVKEFETSLRQRLLRESLESLLTDGITVSDEEAEREFRRRTEQVKIEYVQADAGRFRAESVPTEDEVKARFDAKRDTYRLPEKRVVSYVLLDAEALKPRVAATDGDLQVYYQAHSEEFKQEAEACAAHILVKVKPAAPASGASPADATVGHPEDVARTLAQGLLDQIKGGADFAALAKKSSEDQGSAASGGDLGCFGRGRMVPAFDEAVFAMQAGQVSDLVHSNFGFHIIKLGSIREEIVPTLSTVKERVRQLVIAQKVEAMADQKSGALAAALARGKKLDEAAKEQGLAVQKSAPLARGEAKPPLTSPTLVARAFEMKVGDVEKEGFPLPQGAAFIALAEVQPPRLPELNEVQDQIKNDLAEQKSFARAKALAEEVKAKAEKLGLDKAATATGLVRKETPALTGRGTPLGDLGTSAFLEDAVFTAPEKSLSDPVRTSGGYAILRVLERKAFDPAAFSGQKAQIVAGLRQQKKNELFQAYLNQARARYVVERRAEALKRVMGQGS
jgi:peptidyl-prolyl cis-trans isomerase D